MAPTETRYVLLVGLAWQLRAFPLSCWLVTSGRAEPVLYVRCGDERRDPVLAVQKGAAWRLLWRDTELDAARLDEAARRIATGVAA